MSDDFYETIGRILSDSFSNDRDPFDMAGVPLEDCKHAWKVLLKRVHPDVSNSQGEATSDTVIRLNNSYRRIETWFNTGKIIK